MSTEVWLRHPFLCIREAIEVRADSYVFVLVNCVKKNKDPLAFLRAHYGEGDARYRVIVIGPDDAKEYTQDSKTLKQHVAVHDVWTWGSPIEELTKKVRADGDHRVIVTGLPPVGTRMVKDFLRELSILQADNRHCIVHLHGTYSYRAMFGLGFGAADVDPRESAKASRVDLPNGKKLAHERAAEAIRWINLLGFHPWDLRVPRNRCMYNILSAQWAGKHYMSNVRWSTNRGQNDFVNPDEETLPLPQDNQIWLRPIQPELTDKWLCDTCSLQLSCKFFREGAVCIVPNSEPTELAHFFKTRDADTIIDGLGTLLAAETRRLNRGMQAEEDNDGKINPDVTKIIQGLFDRGVKLAKLVDPSLAAASAPKFNLKINNNTATINAASPQQLMAAVMQEFMQRGIPRESVTPEMVMRILSEPEENKARAIEAAVVELS